MVNDGHVVSYRDALLIRGWGSEELALSLLLVRVHSTHAPFGSELLLLPRAAAFVMALCARVRCLTGDTNGVAVPKPRCETP